MSATAELMRPDVEASDGSLVPAVAFRPKAQDWKLLDALREAIVTDGHTSQRALAKRMGVTHQAVNKQWRRRGFDAWLGAELRRGRGDRFEQLYERCWTLAMGGSIDHAQWCAKVEGKFKQTDAPLSAAPPIQVCIGFRFAGVPLPPQPQQQQPITTIVTSSSTPGADDSRQPHA